MKTIVSEPAVYKNGNLSFFPFFLPGLTQDWTALTFQARLNINQLHFITRSAAVRRFYHIFPSHFRRISLLGSLQNATFVVMYACSEPRAPHTFIAGTVAMAPRARLARGPAAPILQYRRAHVYEDD